MAQRPANPRAAKRKTGKRSARKGHRAQQAPTGLAKQRKASLAKVLSHPTRVQILAASHQEEICPSGFARAHGFKTGTVAPHFRILADYGAIKLVRKEPAGGSVRHWYVGTKRGIITASEWENLPESVQGDIAAAGLQDFIVVTAQAIETGSFSARPGFVLTWDEANLDEKGWEKLTKMFKLVWAKVPSLEDESEMRIEKTGEPGMKAIVGLAAFEAPKPAKQVRKKGKKGPS